MTLTPGRRLGPYEITSSIGAGGMGEVYRAHDSRLNRDVAVKVLPEGFASDPERLARFTREAQTLASLNHPNIAAIYGIEEAPPTAEATAVARALVMELVEGEDLSAHIARGPLPLPDALPIARQIAEALEAAHEHGIVHRDLKPANIKVRSDGTVKVLDFGLAKAMDAAGSSNPNVSHSPTLTSHGTQAGLIIGTAAYMSPEQAKGKTVDRRADIWAFGVVLFEMLTGGRLFKGEDTSDVLAAVLRQEVDWALLPGATPPRLRRLIERCLERDVKERLRDIGEARFEIAKIQAGAPDPATVSVAAMAPTTRVRSLSMSVALLGLALIASVLSWAPWRPAALPPEMRVDIVTPPTDDPSSFALSPDGRQIVFEAAGDGVPRLWLRSLSEPTARALPGTEGGRAPFWSPDSRSIGYFTGTALYRLDLDGGAPRTLAQAIAGRGGTWNSEGVIVFSPANSGPLARVPATGGDPTAVTVLGPGQGGHRSPCFLPDGRRFIFYAFGGPDTAGIYLGSYDGSTPTRLVPAESGGTYLASGWLLWERAGTLLAQRLDASRGALTGEPVRLADGVAVDVLQAAVSAASTGLIAYRTSPGIRRQLTWFDRSGAERGVVGKEDNTYIDPRVSPDGRHVVVARTAQGNTDLWVLDGLRASRFTFDLAEDRFPLWSLDGARILFRSHRTGGGDIYQKFLSGGAVTEERLVTSDERKAPNSLSPGERFLLYHSVSPKMSTDLWIMPLSGDRTPWPFLKTPFRESTAMFSPDGKWVAYLSSESGQSEIYVRPFVPHVASDVAPESSDQWQVSTAGGIMPVWRRDGKELYYLNPSGDLMAAPINTVGNMVEPGTPVRLFPTRIVGGGVDNAQGRQYDVGPDGRFLINTVVGGVTSTSLTLLMNWNPESRK